MIIRKFIVVVISNLATGFCSQALAEEAKVAFGVSRPPYIDERTGSGIVVDLFDSCAKQIGLTYQKTHASNERLSELAKEGDFDIVVEVQPSTSSKYFFSEPFISYRNYFVSQKKLNVNDFKDLEGRVVCGWQGFEKDLKDKLGPYEQKMKKLKGYPLQVNQVRDFLNGTCEVLLVDKNLFLYHEKQILAENPLFEKTYSIKTRSLKQFPGGGELWWYVAFKDKALRDKFNQALSAIKKSGEYSKIVEPIE